MKDLMTPFVGKSKKRKVLGFSFSVPFYILSVSLLVFSCLFFQNLGKALFYGVFFPLALISALLASFFLSEGISSAYELSFFKGKASKKEARGEVTSLKPYSVDRHLDSLKICLKDGSFLYWASVFGECPLKEGGTYAFICSGAWILGWEEI